jgi:hypothetical protein
MVEVCEGVAMRDALLNLQVFFCDGYLGTWGTKWKIFVQVMGSFERARRGVPEDVPGMGNVMVRLS